MLMCLTRAVSSPRVRFFSRSSCNAISRSLPKPREPPTQPPTTHHNTSEHITSSRMHHLTSPPVAALAHPREPLTL